MKTVLITIACTVLATTLLLASITFYYLSQKPKVYTCQKIETI
jgi:hypothetical protein